MGAEGSFPGLKRLRHEADHSPPSSAEVKNGGSILALPRMFLCSFIFWKYPARSKNRRRELHEQHVECDLDLVLFIYWLQNGVESLWECTVMSSSCLVIAATFPSFQSSSFVLSLSDCSLLGSLTFLRPETPFYMIWSWCTWAEKHNTWWNRRNLHYWENCMRAPGNNTTCSRKSP
jgi:hypothetical protein